MTDEIAEMIAEMIKKLNEEFPSELIKQREGRGKIILDYLETPTVIRRLNDVFEHRWDFEVLDTQIDWDHGQIYVLGGLIVIFPDGTRVTKQQYGSSSINYIRDSKDVVDLGDDLKSAASDALKKCATLLGIGLHLYEKTKGAKSSLIQSGPKMATEPQLNAIRRAIRENRLTLVGEQLTKIDKGTLTVKEASTIIQSAT